MSTTLHNIAVRASVLSFVALSFSTPVFGASNGSDSFVQGIISPITPTWIEIPILATVTPTPTPPTATPSSPTPPSPGEPQEKQVRVPPAPLTPPSSSEPQNEVSPPKIQEADYLPAKSARH